MSGYGVFQLYRGWFRVGRAKYGRSSCRGIKWDLDGLNGFGGISLVTEYIWGYNMI
uniref:Candidate secreted effector n=1 Tax=Meloidogyne incognita TaxID=6306 RepID=A0A914NW26_MELIC